jgi:hypothetical protein
MLANQAGHGQACRNIVGDEAILLVEEEPICAKDLRGAHRLLAANACGGIVGRFAVAEINDQRALSDLREFRNRPPICTSASSGCAATTKKSYAMVDIFTRLAARSLRHLQKYLCSGFD